MQVQDFTIIDVETTGGGIAGNKITEICAVRLRGNKVIDKFTSLVNPQRLIPTYITGLTGINNEMVADAPEFYEIAEKVEAITRDAVFVAHNVNFDYNVLKAEFAELGFNFQRKKLCTVRLARKLSPGLPSYSLGKLCKSLSIPLNNRHRAEGDTDATVMLFQQLFLKDTDGEVINKFLNARSRQATLPPHLSATVLRDLPETPGVYFFRDQKGKAIYVGKAKNIKQRVTSHFYDKKNREYRLGQETYHIDCEETGSELLALLHEAEYIRKLYPKYNRAQKNKVSVYHLVQYVNGRGIVQLGISSAKNPHGKVLTRYDRIALTEELIAACQKFELCPKYCGLQTTNGRCSHYEIKTCKGICAKEEEVVVYNQRVEAALRHLVGDSHNMVITEKGRTPQETAVVVIKDGFYQGTGFVDTEVQITHPDAVLDFIEPKKHTAHTERIIRGYMVGRG